MRTLVRHGEASSNLVARSTSDVEATMGRDLSRYYRLLEVTRQELAETFMLDELAVLAAGMIGVRWSPDMVQFLHTAMFDIPSDYPGEQLQAKLEDLTVAQKFALLDLLEQF